VPQAYWQSLLQPLQARPKEEEVPICVLPIHELTQSVPQVLEQKPTHYP